MPNNGVYLCIQRPCCQRDHRILFYTKCTFFRWHTAYMGTVPWPCHMSVIHQSHHLSYSHSHHSLMCYCSANWSNLLYTRCMQDHQHYLCSHTDPEMTKTNCCFPGNLLSLLLWFWVEFLHQPWLDLLWEIPDSAPWLSLRIYSQPIHKQTPAITKYFLFLLFVPLAHKSQTNPIQLNNQIPPNFVELCVTRCCT